MIKNKLLCEYKRVLSAPLFNNTLNPFRVDPIRIDNTIVYKRVSAYTLVGTIYNQS